MMSRFFSSWHSGEVASRTQAGGGVGVGGAVLAALAGDAADDAEVAEAGVGEGDAFALA